MEYSDRTLVNSSLFDDIKNNNDNYQPDPL